MRFVFIIAAIVGIAVISFLLFKPSEPSNKQGAQMNYETIKANGTVFDVRTPEEFTSGHVKEATNLPLGDIQNGTLPTVDKTTPIYVYCRSGSRSATATSLLRNAGFTNVTDLGAMSEVVALGGEVVK